jgi:hypothetical protein
VENPYNFGKIYVIHKVTVHAAASLPGRDHEKPKLFLFSVEAIFYQKVSQ